MSNEELVSLVAKLLKILTAMLEKLREQSMCSRSLYGSVLGYCAWMEVLPEHSTVMSPFRAVLEESPVPVLTGST